MHEPQKVCFAKHKNDDVNLLDMWTIFFGK